MVRKAKFKDPGVIPGVTCECEPLTPRHERCNKKWVRCNLGVRERWWPRLENVYLNTVVGQTADDYEGGE